LYLHGFMGCQDDWTEVISTLGNKFSHLTVDLPGHQMPANRFRAENFTMPGSARLVIDLLDRLQIDQTHLVAYSMGGRLGLYLLTHYSDRFDRAVIESASPGLKTEPERIARREQEERLIDQLRHSRFDQFLAAWYDQPLFATMQKSDPRFAPMIERRRTHTPDALALSLQHMGTSVQPPLWDQLSNLHGPVMFVAGACDDKYCRLAKEMVDLCPAGSKTVIQNAGHNAHWEMPAEFCHLVGDFLTGQK
jgi:2-succinyl-6-hydroxy-2,4-cyclohexadiene-1-carboxylate synthase